MSPHLYHGIETWDFALAAFWMLVLTTWIFTASRHRAAEDTQEGL